MGDFFKEWRRKIGLVTLLMTLVFMMAWIRSLLFLDYLAVTGWVVPYEKSFG